MKSFLVVLAVACGFLAAALYNDSQPVAYAQVSRPNPSATAQADKGVLGIPQPSPFPTCVAGTAFSFADASGCIYDCAGGKLVRRATAFAACGAVPTTGATPTPTATATLTPTPTATST